MIKVHHLNNSRSQRILWLLEELDVPYEIVHYTRMSPVPFAPPELKAVHPLGKSPVITDGKHTIAELGAIIEYVLETYGKGRLQPEPEIAGSLQIYRVDALRRRFGDAAAAHASLPGHAGSRRPRRSSPASTAKSPIISATSSRR